MTSDRIVHDLREFYRGDDKLSIDTNKFHVLDRVILQTNTSGAANAG